MSVWTRISEALAALASGEGLAAVFEKLRSPPQHTVAFAIAAIALSAKMAKADGRVTRDEVRAFREIFTIAPEEEANAARVYNLAREDVAGFDIYARRIARMFGDRHQTLVDLVESLFHIAAADGRYHDAEDAFLAEVSAIFGLSECEFRGIRARYAPQAHPDPYDVLGVTRDMPLDEVRAVWRRLVREHHPDRLAARGVPEEARKVAEARMAAINRAWDEIGAEHAL